MRSYGFKSRPGYKQQEIAAFFIYKMAFVYILYSGSIDKFYTGSCKDLELRQEQHISKFYPDSFTSRADDWTLFFIIENLQLAQARRIEYHIKKMKSKIYIHNLKKYPEMVEKLKVKFA